MPSKQYIFAIGDTAGENLKSFSVGRLKIIVSIVLVVTLWLGLTCLISRIVFKSEISYQTMELRQENVLLRKKFKTWEDQLQQVHNDVLNLKDRNQKIRITASLSLPETKLGTGGSEIRFHNDHLELPELAKIQHRIRLLERDVAYIHRSTSQLEDVLQSKIQEIAHYPSIRPVRGGWLSSPFGNRLDPFTGVEEHHPGLDISIKPETEVLSTGSGTVKVINNKVIKNKGYGKYIIVDHGYGYTTLYGHLSKIFVKPGQKVKRWDLIGLTGNTGKSTAPHIHYGVYLKKKPQDPSHFFLE